MLTLHIEPFLTYISRVASGQPTLWQGTLLLKGGGYVCSNLRVYHPEISHIYQKMMVLIRFYFLSNMTMFMLFWVSMLNFRASVLELLILNMETLHTRDVVMSRQDMGLWLFRLHRG